MARPPKKIDYDQVERLAARGMTQAQIARCIGVSENTVSVKKKTDPKFLAAIEKGAAMGIAAVTGMLLKNINLGKETSIIFFLKCRAGWKETLVIDNKTIYELPGADCTDEQAEAAYIQRMRSPA